MRPSRPSQTAAYVAFLRALGDRGFTSAHGYRDPFASSLLPSRWSAALAWVAPKVAALPPRARERITTHVDLLVHRALAVDAKLVAALGAGCRQVVVLGAGFDSRAHRLEALEAAHVFEVDHPATQEEKRRRAAHLASTCRALTYVACDFERHLLGERLQSAGHRADEPTAWICEGVTLYLDDDPLHALLDAIAARSAGGSTLVVEYHDSEARSATTAYSVVRRLLLAWWSEPQIGARPRRAFRAALERAGFRVAEDFGLSEWGTTFAGAPPRPRTRSARIAVASPLQSDASRARPARAP
ncbi:MAG TPA: class I SAM-dependent methyltransferase [Polyangiaceae bacterium]|jgi:methyltransferase (TIGR00027 family)